MLLISVISLPYLASYCAAVVYPNVSVKNFDCPITLDTIKADMNATLDKAQGKCFHTNTSYYQALNSSSKNNYAPITVDQSSLQMVQPTVDQNTYLNRPVFQWEPVKMAERYALEVDGNIVDMGIYCNCYVPPTALSVDQHHWRFGAFGLQRWVWSNVITFVVNEIPWCLDINGAIPSVDQSLNRCEK